MSGGEWLDKPTHAGIWWRYSFDIKDRYDLIPISGEQLGNTVWTKAYKWQFCVYPTPPPPPLPKSRMVEMTARVFKANSCWNGIVEVFGDVCHFRVHHIESQSRENCIKRCRDYGVEPVSE